jgi:hypothetical protein
VRTLDGRIQIGDVSNAGPVVTVKRDDKDVRVGTYIWPCRNLRAKSDAKETYLFQYVTSATRL